MEPSNQPIDVTTTGDCSVPDLDNKKCNRLEQQACLGNNAVGVPPSSLSPSKSSMRDELYTTRRSPSFITFTLTAADGKIPFSNHSSDENAKAESKRERLRKKWEAMCQKWGFVVVRQLTYEQRTCFVEGGKEEEKLYRNEAQKENSSSSVIYVNGVEAMQVKDELIVSKVFRPSTAHSAGILEEDRIHAVYGMKDPNLSLLFGIMRDSNTFQITVKRLETQYERQLRTTNSNLIRNDHDESKVEKIYASLPMVSDPVQDREMKSCSENQAVQNSLHSDEALNGEIIPGKEGTDVRVQNFAENDTSPSMAETAAGVDDKQFDDFDFSDVDFAAIDAAVKDRQKRQSMTMPPRDQQENNQGDLESPCTMSGGPQTDAQPLHESRTLRPPVEPMYKKPCNQFGVSGVTENDALQYSDDEDLDEELFGDLSDEEENEEQAKSKNATKTLPDDLITKTHQQQQLPSHNSRGTSIGQEKIAVEESDGQVLQNISDRKGVDDDVTEITLHQENNDRSPDIDVSATLMDKQIVNRDENQKITQIQTPDQPSIDRNLNVHDLASADLTGGSIDLVSREQGKAHEEIELTSNPQINPGRKMKSADITNDGKLLGDKELFVAEKQLMEMIQNSLDQTTASIDYAQEKEESKKKRRLSEDSSSSSSIQHGKKKNKKSGKRTSSEDSTNKCSKNGEYSNAKEKKVKRDKKSKEVIPSNTFTGRPPIHVPPEESKRKDREIRSDDGHSKPVTRSNRSFSLGSYPSPSLASRASPSTVSRQKDATTVSSTSSKAGLSQIKSTKLKRLWPDSSVFMKRIMKWCPPEVVHDDSGVFFKGAVDSGRDTSQSLPVIPSNFRDTSEIIKMMSPHILEEGLLSIQQEFSSNSDKHGIWRRETVSLHLRSCTPVDPRPAPSAPSVRTFEFAFSLDQNNTAQPARNLGEMFVIHSPSWKKQQCCIGIIGSNDVNSTFLTDQKLDSDDSYDLFKIWICVCSEPKEKTGWLSGTDMPQKNPDGSFAAQTMYILNIGTCTDMMRQYEGLKSLACVRPHLKRAIYFNPPESENTGGAKGEVIDGEPTQMPSKPSSVVANVWNHLERTTNTFQLSAIEKIMTGKMKENIALLQGPPGTGKTLTTVALVSALLNGTAPVSGSKSQGTRVQIGRAFSSNTGPVMNSNVTRRILVCAPSNQAVDELAWKIHKNALGPNGKTASFNMIRFGMLPGDDRHDGRGKRLSRKEKSFHNNERDKFLNAINLDNLVRDIAGGREIHDFAFGDEKKSSQHRNSSGNKNRKSRYINYNTERQKILSQCHVICTTLSGAGSKAFVEAVSRDQFPQSEFDAVIIDEACQGSEMSCLIPFKYNPNVVCLVGDPSQLPVMTFSQEAPRCHADRSLFDRLHSNGWPINMLRIQYRMHPEIVKFPSKTFYASSLITCDKVMNRRPMPWHDHIAFPPYLVWNLHNGSMSRGANGGISNNAEANFVVNILKSFSELFAHVRNIDIGVISFYNDQVVRIKEKVESRNILRRLNSNNNTLQISTVDGFQGSEKDIIILSCVRSRWHGRSGQNARTSIGFLKDFRRVNVALTRAKHSLWVVANCDTLQRDALWNELILDADRRNLIAKTSLLLDRHSQNRKSSKGRKKQQKKNKER